MSPSSMFLSPASFSSLRDHLAPDFRPEGNQRLTSTLPHGWERWEDSAAAAKSRGVSRKTRFQIRKIRNLWRQNLDGDCLMKACIKSLIDFTHTPIAGR